MLPLGSPGLEDEPAIELRNEFAAVRFSERQPGRAANPSRPVRQAGLAQRLHDMLAKTRAFGQPLVPAR